MKSEGNTQHSPPEPSQESASLLKRLAGPSSTKAGSVPKAATHKHPKRLTSPDFVQVGPGSK